MNLLHAGGRRDSMELCVALICGVRVCTGRIIPRYDSTGGYASLFAFAVVCCLFASSRFAIASFVALTKTLTPKSHDKCPLPKIKTTTV